VPALLNTALAITLHEWTGREEFLVEHENHGRHLEDLDTNRSVGWFTAMYPVRLTLRSSDIGGRIKGIKEQLMKVPKHGLGYGVGRYLKKDTSFAAEPKLRFNYLGQLDAEASNELFRFDSQALALDTDPRNNMTTMLEWNSVVTGDRLMLTLLYNENAHSEATANQLADTFMENLKAVLDHIRGEDDIHFTPSDFSHASLDEEDLDALFR
jgi:surfactin family lipopeptide synthetase A